MLKSSLALLAAALLAGCSRHTPVPDRPLAFVTDEGAARAARLPAPYNSGDPRAGRDQFKLCAGCHGLDQADLQDRGPLLTGIVGAPAATRPGFAYSEALRRSGLTWDGPHLDRWIFNPHESLPGTSMAFVGIRADQKRHDVIAYLAAVAGGPGVK